VLGNAAKKAALEDVLARINKALIWSTTHASQYAAAYASAFDLSSTIAQDVVSQGSTALVGSPETVAAALLDYVDIGCELLSIRGYDPFDDAVGYAKHVLPLVRQELKHRELTNA
jgi:alkanesulfonate monooxygenase SsuD/methylene tetrahydromethanopterin reductase-like flavin-dependent oxidoreductase (luciferase family)